MRRGVWGVAGVWFTRTFTMTVVDEVMLEFAVEVPVIVTV